MLKRNKEKRIEEHKSLKAVGSGVFAVCEFLKHKRHVLLLLFRGKKPIRKLLSTKGTSCRHVKHPRVGEGLKSLPGGDGPTVYTMTPVLNS